MERQTLGTFQTWFDAYVAAFRTGSADDRRNIALKEHHTLLVRRNAAVIAGEIGLDEDERSVAEAVALFHDIGRFPQYREYGTFRDSESINHAALGARVLLESGVLNGLHSGERNLIVRAVALHNVFTLPGGLEDRLLLHSRIVRDADKLDIWRIFIEIFALPAAERPSAAGLGLADSAAVSPEILASLERREMARLTSLRSLNDFKLLQLAWIYDLNFLPSLRLARERGIVPGLAGMLPGTDDVLRAVRSVERYLEERLEAKDR